MAMRGVHFAITDGDLRALRALNGDEARTDYVSNVIEEAWDANFAAQTDKAWGLIHSTLTGRNPCVGNIDLNAGIGPRDINPFGTEHLVSEDANYVIGLVPNSDVGDVRDALDAVGQSDFSARLRALIAEHECEDLDEEDITYAAGWFESLKTVFRAAAEHGRHVIFTVDW